MSADETAAIVKYSEHIVKINDSFTALEDDTLTNATKLPKSMSKSVQFFHRDKTKSDDSRIQSNIRILHTEDMQIILGDLSYELEELELTVGLQRAQHHGIVKVGRVYRMMDNIGIQKCNDRLTKLLFQALKFKPLISLQTRKINYDAC